MNPKNSPLFSKAKLWPVKNFTVRTLPIKNVCIMQWQLKEECTIIAKFFHKNRLNLKKESGMIFQPIKISFLYQVYQSLILGGKWR